jgi:hypothetical protein
MLKRVTGCHGEDAECTGSVVQFPKWQYSPIDKQANMVPRMGRPIGSVNKEKPFNDALRIALKRDPCRLPRIAEKLAQKAEEGDLAAIREIADRLDGKPTQLVDRGDVPIHQLSDAELHFIASGGLEEGKVLLIPPAPKVKSDSQS